MFSLLSALFFGVAQGGCDNGKLWLERDLPPSPVWICPGPLWPESTQKLPGINTQYHPQTAQHVCMDTPISYNQSIPNSGASRPLGGKSGEYLYCPPQRWINNLQHGATVLLYHPCAPVHQRVRLSVLARSCLSSYIITPHPDLSRRRPFAMVSWGRILELEGAQATEICNWLEETVAGSNHGGDDGGGKYSLLLTRPAQPTRRRPDQALKHCCHQTLSSNQDGQMDGGRRRRETLSSNQDGQMDGGRRRRERRRWRRASIGEEVKKKTEEVKEKKVENAERWNHTSDVLGSATASWLSKTLPGSAEPRTQNHVPPRPGPTPLSSGAPRTDRSPSSRPQAHAERDTPREMHSDVQNPTKEEGNVDTRLVEVQEREVEHKHAHVLQTKRKGAESEPGRQGGGGVTQGGRQRVGRVTPVPPGGAVLSERIPTARTDEAVWAAAALGFLLVLLALSVLHTRLYRHWRTTPSLYWHDPRNDYDSVGDIVRMRLRMADQRRKRRKKRASLSRREEYSLLPSSSSEEEDD